MPFTLPPASAARLAAAIRRERDSASHGLVIRLAAKAAPSMWGLKQVAEKIPGGYFCRIKAELTSAPDFPALFSLVSVLCKRQPALYDQDVINTTTDHLRFKKLSRRERAFLVHAAQQAQAEGVWLCESRPLHLVFNCPPKFPRRSVSIGYPEVLVEYVLEKLDESAAAVNNAVNNHHNRALSRLSSSEEKTILVNNNIRNAATTTEIVVSPLLLGLPVFSFWSPRTVYYYCFFGILFLLLLLIQVFLWW